MGSIWSPCQRRLFGLIGIHFGQKPAPGHATLAGAPSSACCPPLIIDLAIHNWIKANLFGPTDRDACALVCGGIC